MWRVWVQLKPRMRWLILCDEEYAFEERGEAELFCFLQMQEPAFERWFYLNYIPRCAGSAGSALSAALVLLNAAEENERRLFPHRFEALGMAQLQEATQLRQKAHSQYQEVLRDSLNVESSHGAKDAD